MATSVEFRNEEGRPEALILRNAHVISYDRFRSDHRRAHREMAVRNKDEWTFYEYADGVMVTTYADDLAIVYLPEYGWVEGRLVG